MRTKAFLMSTSLAASVWLTGCQNAVSHRYADQGSGCATCSAKATPDGKDSLRNDLTHLPAEKTEKTSRPTSLPIKTPLTTNAATITKSGGPGSIAGPVAKAPVAAASDNTCVAKTGSVVVRDPVIYTLPGAPTAAPANSAPTNAGAANVAPMPTSLRPADAPATEYLPPPVNVTEPNMPPAHAPATSAKVSSAVAPTQPPVAASYGPGVEIVPNQGNETLPAASGERADVKRTDEIRIGQANNYHVVVGQLYQFRRAWKLRYTAVESDDKYGGSFTLVGDNLDHLKDGQIVRVEGSVLPSDDRTSVVRYQVSRVEVIEPDVK